MKEFDTSLDFAAKELATLEFWEKEDIFSKSIFIREGKKEFTFYDGPPTANGKPHIGHILTRVIKDIIPRYQTMKGKRVLRKAGWDTHGLPVELEVEKSLNLDGKADIENYGVEKFIKKCKESVFTYQTLWEEVSKRIGYFVDMKNPYVTYHDEYIESVWWALAEIFNKGLIYKGYKVVPFCTRCGTALSSHEVSQGYKDVDDTSAVVKFKLEGEDSYILAWTTTPWTLPSNVALAVNPKAIYAEVSSNGERFILAKSLIEKHFSDYTIIREFLGSELENKRYIPLFDNAKFSTQTETVAPYFIALGDFVTLQDGTGVVHIAPSYGEDDASIGRKYNLPFLQMVGATGKFDSRSGELNGKFCKDADKDILKELKIRGLLFSKSIFRHSYPFCWRCHKPLIYFAREQWFIQTTAVKKQLIKNSNSVNWMPDNVRTGRMGDFLENIIDWGISRERYWGTPLPIWVCGSCNKKIAIGSKKELKELSGLKGDIELHKPFVDAIALPCECGEKMHRTSEVIDCWFDSGAMPFAAISYPFKNKEAFNRNFPADFISEAVDQTRGWFYTLLAISTLLFNKAPFKNCIVLGHVCDKDGKKMSKHIGNVVEPMPIIEKYGADAVRWYFYTASAPYLPTRFYGDAVAEAQRKFLGTLQNICGFYSLYAGIDNFNPSKHSLSKQMLTTMDRWILSELNSLNCLVDNGLKQYKITETARAIEKFVDTLSNWYIRRNRERFWANGMDSDKTAAFLTLYTVIETLTKIIAPFVPFMAESIYQGLVLPKNKTLPVSVHLCDWPKLDKKRIDSSLEKDMQLALLASSLGHSARNSAKIKIRQPLRRLYIVGEKISDELKEIIKDELNVKQIDFLENATEFVSFIVKPQLKTLGPKYGKKINAIREYLASNSSLVLEKIKAFGEHSFEALGEKIVLTENDILSEAKSKEGYASENFGNLAVVLDTSLDAQLIAEGIVRELISKVQNIRKDSGFEVLDRVRVKISADKQTIEAIKAHSEKFCRVTLCDNLSLSLGELAVEVQKC